jgi:Domain of unknown function (DUF4326)
MPKVINLRGRKPKVVPKGAVHIGGRMYRGGWRLDGSKWENPWKVRQDATAEERAEVIRKYERHLIDSGLINDIHELRGMDLACWCAPEACHGDALLRLANG